MNRHTSVFAILVPLLLVSASILVVHHQLGGLAPDPPVDVTTAPAPPLCAMPPHEVPPTILQSRPNDEEVLPAAAKVAQRPNLNSLIPATEGTVHAR